MPDEAGLVKREGWWRLHAVRDPSNLLGFALASVFAVAGGWTLPEFCWSVWLAGLSLAWIRTVSGAAEINADFSTTVTYLTVAFWPMALGTLVANWTALFGGDPWKRMLVPAEATVLRTHLLVVLMPFIALLAWALVGDTYHSVAIVALMALFYLV